MVDVNTQEKPQEDFYSTLAGPLTEAIGPIADPMTRLLREKDKVTQTEMEQKATREAAGATGKAQAARQFATAQQQAFKGYDKLPERPKDTITQDTQQGLQGLAMLLPVAGLFLGAVGNTSGVNAMNAMTGILKGYKEGNDQRIAFETKKYESAIKEWEANYKKAKEGIDRAIEIAKTNYQAGVAEADAAARKIGSTELAAMVRSKTLGEIQTMMNKVGQDFQTAKNRTDTLTKKSSADRTTSVIGPDGQTILVTQEQAAQAAREGRPYTPAGRAMPSAELAYRDWIRPGGQGGKNILAVNTVAQHLTQLDELGKALNNSDYPTINKIANRYSAAVGQDPVTNFNAAKQAVAGEIVRVITQTGGALADRQEAETILDAAKSPAQLEGAIGTIKNLIGGRINSAKYLYEVGTRRKDFNQMLTPDARKAFGKYVEEDASTDQSAPNNADPLGLR